MSRELAVRLAQSSEFSLLVVFAALSIGYLSPEVDNEQIRVSVYSRPESPRLLLVVGNPAKQPGETNIQLDLRDSFNWTAPCYTA